jgi:hypothetical protein
LDTQDKKIIGEVRDSLYEYLHDHTAATRISTVSVASNRSRIFGPEFPTFCILIVLHCKIFQNFFNGLQYLATIVLINRHSTERETHVNRHPLPRHPLLPCLRPLNPPQRPLPHLCHPAIPPTRATPSNNPPATPRHSDRRSHLRAHSPAVGDPIPYPDPAQGTLRVVFCGRECAKEGREGGSGYGGVDGRD